MDILIVIALHLAKLYYFIQKKKKKKKKRLGKNLGLVEL